MLSGSRRKPTINTTSVEAALNTLVYSTTDTSSAATLLSLVVVENFIHDPARPPAKNLREFAVKSILCTLIEDTLIQFRTNTELTIPSKNDTLSIAKAQIQRDSEYNSPDLIGWSFLYYRYVRVDISISQKDFGDYANIEARTILRYKTYAIERLADKLIEAEWMARQQKHQARLRADLPILTQHPLIGREQPLSNTLQLLLQNTVSRCYVTGATGIGKSVFLSAIAQKLIDADAVDYVVWIDAPRTPDEVLQAIQEVILPPHSRQDMREILVAYPTLIILDNVSSLGHDNADFSNLLDYLSPCIVCLSSEQHLPLKQSVFHVHLAELNPTQTLILLEQLQPDISSEQAKCYANIIWKQIGGNPQAIQLALLHLIEGNALSDVKDLLHTLYGDLFANLTENQQMLWICVAANYTGKLSQEVIALCAKHGLFSENDVTHLTKKFILQSLSDEYYAISSSAQKFIAAQPKTDISAYVSTLISHVLQSQESFTLLAFHKFALGILAYKDLILADVQILGLLRTGWAANKYFHDLYLWLRVFKRHRKIYEAHPDLQLAYGICLRQMNHLKEAHQVFELLMSETGQKGAFETQANVLVEMAILFRKQGKFELAQTALERGQRIIQHRNTDIKQRIIAEKAQIEIEQHKPDIALEWLKQLPEQSTEMTILTAEALFLLQRYRESQNAVENIFPQLEADKDFVKLASAATIIARSYEQQHTYHHAIDWFNAALSYTEQQRDDFGTARLKCNLAAVILKQGEYDRVVDAEKLLQEAEATQINLSDRLGLEATRHNLQYVKRIKAQMPSKRS